MAGCNHHRARAPLSVALRKQSHRKVDLQEHQALFSRNTAQHIPVLRVPGSSPSLQAQHPSTYLLTLAAHLLAPPHSHPSTGWNIVSLARGCSPGEHSRHPLDTLGKHEMPAIYPVPLLFAPSSKQLAAVYPPEQDSSPLDEVFGCSCQDRRNICSEELGPHLLP